MTIRTLKKGSLTSSSKVTVLANSIGSIMTIGNAVLCNTTTSNISVTIWIADGGGVETMITKKTIPAGIGKSLVIAELIGGINASYSIKMQSTQAGVDYIIYGAQSAA